MRSFARVVQAYCDAVGTGLQTDARRRLAQVAAADLNELFATHNWRRYELEVDTYLWGTEDITISSINGELVTFTDTANERWVAQDLIIPGSTTPHTIIRINATNSFIIDPAYSGDTVESGTEATIRQVRCRLPCNFGALLDPVLRDKIESRPTSPHEFAEITRGSWASSFCHSVQGNNLLIWPARSGRLFFRYKFQPTSLFEYGIPSSEAIVYEDNPRFVIGSNSFWTQIPDDGEGSVFESDDSINRGFPESVAVTIINDDDSLTLGADWKTPFGTAFPYHISTDLDLPTHLTKYVIARSQFQAGKRDERYCYQTLLAAIAADGAIDQRINRVTRSGIVSVISGSRS